MKKILKTIIKVIIIIFLYAIVSAVIDYSRIKDNKKPIFTTSQYDKQTRVQTYQGLLYSINRKIYSLPEEPIEDSKNITYSTLLFKEKIKIKKKELSKNEIKYIQEESCTESKLIFADKTNKIYYYCINNLKLITPKETIDFDIKIKDNNKYLNKLINSIPFTGLYNDNKTEIYRNNDLKVFKCQNNNYYITTPNNDFQEDFCTVKDDDFKFLFEIVEETENIELLKEKEVFYEDEEYTYEFDEAKSNYIYLVTEGKDTIPSKKINIKTALENKLITITDLEEKGLKFNKNKK